MPRLDIPPPANWEDFGDRCFDLSRPIWDDPKARKHGRWGQPQTRVDDIAAKEQPARSLCQ